MKRFAILLAVLVLVAAIPAVAQERSPDRSHVSLSPVPQDCLVNGSAQRGRIKYTCNKVDSSDVWNDAEADSFQKEIFEAYQQPVVVEPSSSRIGLVVKQDSVSTRPIVEKRSESVTSKETAYVNKQAGYKYRYAHK